MSAVSEMLKATEAAVVSRVSLREVNRVIDERILPEAFVSIDNGRHILAGACSLIAFYVESAERLTSNERLYAIRTAEDRLTRFCTLPGTSLLREDWVVRHDFLTIDLMPFMKDVLDRLRDLAEARKLITSSPDILGGAPIVRNTRVPAHDVAASLAAGHSTERIREAWPSLDAEQIRLAAIYAQANPLRGRPRVSSRLPEGASSISDRRVQRLRKAG